MTITFIQLLLYSGALFILFITPGPVWVAIIARSLSGGFKSSVPLALGVAIGDIIWPLIALIGVSYLVSIYADILLWFRYLAAIILIAMGMVLIIWPNKTIGHDSKLTAPGFVAGLMAGLVVVIANPKASLFYMGLLPGFFDFNALNKLDIFAICLTSFLVPLLGNLCLALFVDKIRRFLASPDMIKKVNISAGMALILIGVIIGLS